MEAEPKEQQNITVNNQRLNTPSLKRLALINDGSQALKDEIHESYLRVKAAKHGMKLKDLVPNHDNFSFYLPNKLNYVRPKEYQKIGTSLASSTTPTIKQSRTTKHRDNEDRDTNTFLTSVNQSNPMTNSKSKMVDRSFNQKLNSSINMGGSIRSHEKNKLNSTQIISNQKSKSKDRSAIKFNASLLLKRGANIPNKLNYISHKYNRDTNIPLVEQRRKIRLISLIDSKPINHYIALLTLKEFSKREQEMSGVAGSIQTTSGFKGNKNQDVAKILREDLNEKYEEKIGRLIEERRKAKYEFQFQEHYEDDLISLANTERSKEPTHIRKPSKVNQEISDNNPNAMTELQKDINEKIKAFINPDFVKMLDDNLKRDIVNLLYNKQENEAKDPENSTDNKPGVENEEQARRLQQLKREQELAEFEEKGGFARILRNFFNPTDESVELDSVYQLKQL